MSSLPHVNRDDLSDLSGATTEGQVRKLTANGAVDDKGVEHPVNVLILATGFKAADYLGDLDIKGLNNVRLHDYWKGEPSAFLGLCVPGFPNFFMMYGPNTNAGPLVFFFETQAAFIVNCLCDMIGKRKTTVEVKTEPFEIYNKWLQRRLRGSVFAMSSNYYKSATGKIVTQWPFMATTYGLLARMSRRFVMKYV